MAKLKVDLDLRHRANLGEEIEEQSFHAGDELTVLKEWDDSVLCKDDAGKLFHVPKDKLEL